MFLVKSAFSLDSAAPTRSPPHGRTTLRAPLLPKLRGHFAEFLDHESLERLGILYLTTCVGFGYGRTTASRRRFSRQHRITRFPSTVPIRPHPHTAGICLGGGPHPWPCQAIRHGRATSLRHACYHACHTKQNAPRPHAPRTPKGTETRRAGTSTPRPAGIGRPPSGTGMSTRCPSTTPDGLALGPD